MSAFILSQAVTQTLQDGFVTDGICQSGNVASFVNLQPNGNPPTAIGKFFISVDVGNVTADGDETFIQESYGLTVFITKPARIAASDRYRALYTEPVYGLDPLKQTIIKYLHGNPTVMSNANALITDETNPFFRSVYLKSCSGPHFMDGSWAICHPDQTAFIILELTFNGGDRLESIGP